MYWISLLYWSSSTQKHEREGGEGDITIHQKMDWIRNGEKKAVCLNEIEKGEGHYSIMTDSDEVT